MRKIYKASVVMLIAALVLGLVVVNDTFALMTAPAKSVINTFSIAEIDTGIDETLTEGNKQVSITNQGPSDAYVRARIMVSGVENGQVQIVKTTEEANTEAEKNLTRFIWSWAKVMMRRILGTGKRTPKCLMPMVSTTTLTL